MAIQYKTDQLLYKSRGPLDPKSLVKTYNDLTNLGTWIVDDVLVAYNGMIVAVWLDKTAASNNGIYYLFDPLVTTALKKPDVTKAENWHKISELTDLTFIESTLSGHEERVKALEGKDAEIINQIKAAETKFNNYYDKDTVDAKIVAIVNNIDFTPYAKTADVDASIAAINVIIAEKANAANVYTKTEADLTFMTQDEVDARINTLINAADPEGGKAITNIHNLVKFVEENASDISDILAVVNDNATAIEKNTEDIVAINNLITVMVTPKESDEISVAEDGTLGIKEVNINKLTQNESDVLVLNGGSASEIAC